MTSRTVDGTTYAMGYDSENRMTTITGGSLTARYVFDGDGRRVLSVVGDTRTLYVNEYFEVTMENDAKANQDLTIEDVDICENRYCVFIPLAISDIEAIGMQSGNFGTGTLIPQGMQPENANVTWRIYYPGGGLRVQTTTGDNLSYLVQDHLNSTALTINTSGTITGEIIYSAFGETRFAFGSTSTDRLYTGQYEAEAGLYFYNARWYDKQLGRFVQADSIIPEPGNPQSWDRFAYAGNNPVKYTDPTGHAVEATGGIGGYMDKRDLTIWLIRAAEYMAEDSATQNIHDLVTMKNNSPYVEDGYEYWGNMGEAYSGFYDLVHDGARFDVKDKILSKLGEKIIIGNDWFEYSTAGNILYGFYGAAAGFDLETLRLGAGAAQVWDHYVNEEGELGPLACYLDTMDDYRAVQFGYTLFEGSYATDRNLTAVELMTTINTFSYWNQMALVTAPADFQALHTGQYPPNHFDGGQ